MNDESSCAIAILYPGDREARATAAPETSRYRNVYDALSALGARVELAVYHDDCCEELRQQLVRVDGVLVWVNPIHDGRDRATLDAMLRVVAAHGVFVSAHPDIILKLGTKEVLYQTRALGWGCDTHLITSLDQMRSELAARLASGEVRVLKQYRGQSGDGVWKVERVSGDANDPDRMQVRARHAKRGCVAEDVSFAAFLKRCEVYFVGKGRMIDQQYQTRLQEGMIRCYLVQDKVAGFGHQAINALYPAPPGTPSEAAPQPGPRLYHPPTVPAFQPLKRRLEQDWVPALQKLIDIGAEELPVMWDCDFLLGPKTPAGEDSYVLCEINASCVSPFPDAALPALARVALARALAAKQSARR